MVIVAAVLFVLVCVAGLVDCIQRMNAATTDEHGPTPREVFIERLRAGGGPLQREYATVLELGEPSPGETGAELAEGYRAFLTQVPEPVTAPLRHQRGA